MTRDIEDIFSRTPGKYRRAFDWRLSHGEPDSLRTEASAMMRLATSDFPDILEDFLEISRRRRKNWTALARLQTHMLEELLVQEGAVKHYRILLKKLEDDAKLLPAIEPEPAGQVEFVKQQLFLYRQYANAIRAIGDGIAWRTLGYDRAVTRLMSERETKQWLTSEGLIQELREWSFHFERGTGIAILNALTNCLAIGDVTVVRPDDSVEIIEVKSSNAKSGRKVRQKQKMSEVVTLLDRGAGQSEGRDIQIEILPVTPETGLDQLEELLQTASQEGVAAKKISNCLYAEAFDCRRIDDPKPLYERLQELRDKVVGEWTRRGDLVIDFSSLDSLAFTPNCAPFAIYPFSARTCVDLLIGSKFYVTYLNHNAVAREFENRGWVVEQTTEQLLQLGNRDAVMKVAKGKFHVFIPHADFMRLQMEALRAKTLIQAYEVKFGQQGQSEETLLSVFSGESVVWD